MAKAGGLALGPRPGDPGFGATVDGVPRAALTDEAVSAQLRAAWIDRGVLVFRGVEGEEMQLEFSRCFGRLIAHSTRETRADRPELMTVR